MGLPMKWSRRARRIAHWTFAGAIALGLGGPVPAGATPETQAQRYEDLALFANIVDLVRENYVTPADEHELMQSAMRGLLGELDPHSAFMSKDAYDEMQVDTRGEFDGIGIEINKAQGQYIKIVSPFDGTPAFRIGLKAQDLIVSICPTEVPESWAEGETCRTTEEMSLFEAVQLMRGKRGTEITLEILREGWQEPHSFTISRDVVKVDSVESETLTPGFGYLRISEFKERTNDELTRALAKLHSENPTGLEGLVIDLRDNPGGLLNQAVVVADHWLGEGLIVYTQGRDESSRENYAARPGVLEAPYPIVVLVNEGSASASEIVAGALQDQGRALVMGMRTFGKGSVQTVYPLDGGAGLRLTTALYYTPLGRSIQEVGIEPDVEVHPGSPETSVLYRGVREQDLRRHISHDAASSGLSDDDSETKPAEDAGDEEVSESETSADETSADETPADEPRDVLVTRALEVLKSWTYFDRLSDRREAPAPGVQGKP
ncbi:MAG: S41 family peptidase [Myxococcota bacterium]|nr:S41 family peptidase [Myxococcota bacterium]